jgi:hypothetical protein
MTKKKKQTKWQGTLDELKKIVPSKATQIMENRLEFVDEKYVFTVIIEQGFLLIW